MVDLVETLTSNLVKQRSRSVYRGLECFVEALHWHYEEEVVWLHLKLVSFFYSASCQREWSIWWQERCHPCPSNPTGQCLEVTILSFFSRRPVSAPSWWFFSSPLSLFLWLTCSCSPLFLSRGLFLCYFTSPFDPLMLSAHPMTHHSKVFKAEAAKTSTKGQGKAKLVGRNISHHRNSSVVASTGLSQIHFSMKIEHLYVYLRI